MSSVSRYFSMGVHMGAPERVHEQGADIVVAHEFNTQCRVRPIIGYTDITDTDTDTDNRYRYRYDLII